MTQAEPLYERALKIYESSWDLHPDTATSLNNLAVLYNNQGKYRAGRALLLSVPSKSESSSWEPDHPDTATSLNNLALPLQQPGQVYGGRTPLRAGAQDLEEQLGASHPETAASLNNLAGFCITSQGKYTEAEPLYEWALKIERSSWGPLIPIPLTSLNNLAGLYRARASTGGRTPLCAERSRIT